jgi:four helix bundle protein
MSNYKEELLAQLTANTSLICIIADSLKYHPIAKYLIAQLVRSGSASSLIYAESIDAESIKDLIHKLALVQKELRETKTNLIILSHLKLNSSLTERISTSLSETDRHLAQISQGLITLRAKHRQYLQEKSNDR